MPTQEGLIAGIIELKINGEIKQAKGDFTFNEGNPKLSPILNTDNTVAGFKGETQAPRIEGELTDNGDLDVHDVTTLKNQSATLSLSNGKIFTLEGATYIADGDYQTGESNIQLILHGTRGKLIKS